MPSKMLVLFLFSFMLLETMTFPLDATKLVIDKTEQINLMSILKGFELDPIFWEGLILGYIEDYKDSDDFMFSLWEATDTSSQKYKAFRIEAMTRLAHINLKDFEDVAAVLHDAEHVQLVLKDVHERMKQTGTLNFGWVEALILRRLAEESNEKKLFEVIVNLMIDVSLAM